MLGEGSLRESMACKVNLTLGASQMPLPELREPPLIPGLEYSSLSSGGRGSAWASQRHLGVKEGPASVVWSPGGRGCGDLDEAAEKARASPSSPAVLGQGGLDS